MKQTVPRLLLAIFFIAAGILHFVFPVQYASVVPPWLPWHHELVVISGLCEIAGGIGILPERTRVAAGIGLILLSLAVLPANVQMLLDAQAAGKSMWAIALLWLRLPLQLLLIMWIWRLSIRRRATYSCNFP
jgi:uncharacterized membrane protein